MCTILIYLLIFLHQKALQLYICCMVWCLARVDAIAKCEVINKEKTERINQQFVIGDSSTLNEFVIFIKAYVTRWLSKTSQICHCNLFQLLHTSGSQLSVFIFVACFIYQPRSQAPPLFSAGEEPGYKAILSTGGTIGVNVDQFEDGNNLIRALPNN